MLNAHRISIRAYAYLVKLDVDTSDALSSSVDKRSKGFDFDFVGVRPGKYADMEQRLAGMLYTSTDASIALFGQWKADRTTQMLS